MATEYHLLTQFGLGVTATLSVSSPCVVTAAGHGCKTGGGSSVIFTTTGALPTGIVASVTYFANRIDTNTFHLYTTKDAAIAGGATGRVNTSGSQSGTHTITGAYWYNLPTTNPGDGGNYRNRYLQDGVFQVFRSFYDWHLKRHLRENILSALVLEIQGNWVDDQPVPYIATLPIKNFYSCLITTKVNGVRDIDAYHKGVIGGGWYLATSYNNTNAPISFFDIRVGEVDGIEVNVPTVTVQTILNFSLCKNCILRIGSAYLLIGGRTQFYNNIVYGASGTALMVQNWQSAFASAVYNNLIVKNNVGVDALGVNTTTFFMANNVSVGNTTNWGANVSTIASNLYAFNAGSSGDAIWTSSGQSNITGVVTTPGVDFIDFANNDFRYPAGSKLIDAGMQMFDFMEPVAITNILLGSGDPRPSYNNGGTEVWDLGPFEYDKGFGLAPKQVTLSITGMAEGSALAIYKTSDGSEILAPTTIGASGSYSMSYSYTGDVPITVRVRKATSAPKYQPYTAPGLITAGGFGLAVSQVPDPIAG